MSSIWSFVEWFLKDKHFQKTKKQSTYKIGPPNYYKWVYPYSYTHLQRWLNSVCWGYYN